MKNITRTLIVGIGLSVASVSLSPLSSSAWQENAFSISSTGGPIALVMNEDQFKGKWKQFKGEVKKKWGNFTDDDLLFIEGRRDKLEGSVMGIGRMK
jgi:uncharacterized protein YjbJ (UPF0337 family)